MIERAFKRTTAMQRPRSAAKSRIAIWICIPMQNFRKWRSSASGGFARWKPAKRKRPEKPATIRQLMNM